MPKLRTNFEKAPKDGGDKDGGGEKKGVDKKSMTQNDKLDGLRIKQSLH